jgi:hypothetical protein
MTPSCRQCLAPLINATAPDHGYNGTKADVLRSPACTAGTSLALLKDLVKDCGGTGSFPLCTFFKQQCASLPKCASCMTTFGVGDGVGAAQQCSGSTQPSALALDNVVGTCMVSSAAACDFWSQRCSSNEDCGSCLAGMGNGDNAGALATDWSAPACQRAMQDSFALDYLTYTSSGCPGISACRAAVTTCVFSYNDTCLLCINGSAPHTDVTCSNISQQYSFDTSCQPCSASVQTINSIVVATTVVGVASAATCIAVATTIVAHGHDRVSMRDRILFGLMTVNAVYSTSNAIPLNALRTGVVDCGRLAMSFDAIRFGRAWWFCGKYGLVGFELFILGASIRALRHGMLAVPRRAEVVMRAACSTLAELAFVVFYALCARINADGYNTTTENAVYTNAINHASINDDLDDDSPSTRASLVFQNGRDEYDNLVRNMLVAWDVVVGVAVGLWVALRTLHMLALRALRTEAVAAAQAEASDEWRDTRRSAWEARRRLLEARREAFNEVARPLEPYIAVFVVFAAPAFVMSTRFCQSHSGASAVIGRIHGVGVNNDSSNFTYGTCDVWCEFVLAFRSLASVAVYLASRKRLAELIGVRTTLRKLCTRVLGCISCTPASYALLDHGHGIEMDTLNERPANDTANTAAPPSWQINDRDIQKVRLLGRGGFGEVWVAFLEPGGRRVAVKFMLAAVVDDDGDLVNPYADEDFRKECDALQRVDSPYLLKFFGFGTTASGSGFIVTEVLAGGSLMDLLHDPERDVPWHARVSIGLQVALGMEHLHKKHMLYRDLKSANVLLDEDLKAKVCDFGLSRVVRPARRHVVVRSSFTGVTKLLPSVNDSIDIDSGQSTLLSNMSSLGVSFVDAHGTMTKAAGTLLWMAPEVYLGDQTYTGAVDVYSFGIVLWELATRKARPPWVEELSSETVFFEQLNNALQTGRRPAIPGSVLADHSTFVAVMRRCWAGDPADRPTFSQAAADLFCLRLTM